MKTYLIAGIPIRLKYHYDAYLKHNIELYEKDIDEVKHTFEVHITDHIELPQGKSKSIKNPYIIFNEQHRIIYMKDQINHVKALIKHDYMYQKIDIFINPQHMEHPEEFEYTWLGLMFMEIALKYQLLPLHASAIDNHGKGLLIVASSQTGKSTHAKLWQDMDPDIKIINDDKPLIGFHHQQLYIYSSPFSGKTAHNENRMIPLEAIVFLYQGKQNEIIQLDHEEIIIEFLKNMMRPNDEKTWDDVIDLINQIMASIPIMRLNATPHLSAAEYLREQLNQGD